MMKRSSPHVHTQFCDGRSTAEEIVVSAMARGFVSLGFSSHALQDFDLAYAMDARREQAYIAEVRRLREKYAGNIRIWLGMERDSLSIARREPFEYVIGSVHYFKSGAGDHVAVDGPLDMVLAMLEKDFGGDWLSLAEAYYDKLGSYAALSRPDIIGHFDLISKHNAGGRFFDENHPRYLDAAFRAMDLAITGCGLMEVNTGAIARSGASQPYPKQPLLRYWKSIGGEVILASDCHNAEQIDAGYGIGERHIRDAGYQKAAFLGRHGQLFEWDDLT